MASKKKKQQKQVQAKGKARARKASARARKTSAPARRASAAARKAPAPARKGAVRKPAQPSWRPEGASSVTPNLVFKDASGAIAFYTRAFGAVELMRMPAPDGKSIWHAEIRIGDSVVYVNDAMGPGPVAAGPDHAPTCSFVVYVPDCDKTVARAVQAGCTTTMPLEDMFWGDRMGGLADPYGQQWMIATKVRDVPPEEAQRAGEEWARQQEAKTRAS